MSASERELLLPTGTSFAEAIAAKERAVEEARAALEALVGKRDASRVSGWCIEMLDAHSDADQLKVREIVHDLGAFICNYGQPELWKALWCRFALCDAFSWDITPDYHEGDEIRAIWGDRWRSALRSIIEERDQAVKKSA